MTKLLITITLTVIVLAVLYWLVIVPKPVKRQAALEDLTDFDFQTTLLTEIDSSFPNTLLLRRVPDSPWKTSGEHTQYQLKEYLEPSMGVGNIKPDAYLKKSLDDPARILIGRYDDRGAGMHGWHVTMIRQGPNPILFDRHQRYHVWIEKEFPVGFNDNGEPISNDPKRWYFAGPADIIAVESYQGYVEPLEEDN